jgi:hypothetical protein
MYTLRGIQRNGTFAHQLPFGGFLVFSTVCFTVVVMALLQLLPSICFELFYQCRLAVCIVKPVQFLSILGMTPSFKYLEA